MKGKPVRYRTRQLGVMEIAKDKVLCFVAPLLGFESFRKYTLLPVAGARPFFSLQSLEEPQLAFPVLRADELAIEYPLSPDDLRRVAATSPDQITCWVVVALPADGTPIRPNLRAPLVVNEKKQLAAQIVVSDECPIGRALNLGALQVRRRESAAGASTASVRSVFA
ncbi:MAG: flagellar assembly protein FliW [Candidatus Brocadiia bacterium]